jgi:hypothetical protein
MTRIVYAPTTLCMGDARMRARLELHGIDFDAAKNPPTNLMTLHETSEQKLWWIMREIPVFGSPKQIVSCLKR